MSEGRAGRSTQFGMVSDLPTEPQREQTNRRSMLCRATVRQKKTGQPVRFELTEHTRQAVDDYLRVAAKTAGQYLFTGRHGLGGCMSAV